MSLVPARNGQPSMGRGPAPGSTHMDAALDDAQHLVLEALELDADLSNFLDRWLANAHLLHHLALRGPGTEFMSRELRNAVRMRAPEPFWNRDVVE